MAVTTGTVTVKPVTVYPDHQDENVNSVLGKIEVERSDTDEIRLEVETVGDGDSYQGEVTVYLTIQAAQRLQAGLGLAILDE